MGSIIFSENMNGSGQAFATKCTDLNHEVWGTCAKLGNIQNHPYLSVQFLLLLLFFFTSCHRVLIEDGFDDAGQSCFRITTPGATYFYQKEAGGFSSILDQDGIDWIGFSPDSAESYPSSAATSYRGLPNIVFGSDDGGAGHPGFRKCKSVKLSADQIRTVSGSGKWQWTWTFKENFALLSMEKTDDSHPYWFLYEGTVGGRFKPHEQYWGTDKGGPLDSTPDYFKGEQVLGNWQWFYAGDNTIGRVFFMIQKEPDQLHDTFSYLGNTEDGINAQDGMVVCGFGRTGNAIPLLKSANRTFIIGFFENRIRDTDDHKRLAGEIQRIIDK
jgi:hypothetical protein